MTYDEKLKQTAKAVSYTPETGFMVWREKPLDIKNAARWNANYAGAKCGTINPNGYQYIVIRFPCQPTFSILAHRLAWFITHGKLPDQEIDHINQDKLDNRLANLRDVSHKVNLKNRTRLSNNTSGFTGVVWCKKSKKWRARVKIDGKLQHIGLYSSITEADTVAREFRKANGFTETHGRQI